MRRIIGITLRSISSDKTHFTKPLSTFATSSSSEPGDTINNKGSSSAFESNDVFEQRIFGGLSPGDNGSASDSFFQKLDRLEKARNRSGSKMNEGHSSYFDGLDESFNTLSDGMDGKLKKAATYFDFDPEEVLKDDYAFRPDMTFQPGTTYDVKDLDLTKPGASKPSPRYEFEVTTEEVLRKADFRNVRFLANFITEAGIMHKRSKTGISAKAQRKVAREIKTARAFGLLPFTTMGAKSFVFGRTMENLDQDYEYERSGGRPDPDNDEVETDPLQI